MFLPLVQIPYGPQLNAIEMVFSRLKSCVVSESVQSPEGRKNLRAVTDESMVEITQKNIENYFRHQATVIIQCLKGVLLTADTLKYNEVDEIGEESPDEVYE